MKTEIKIMIEEFNSMTLMPMFEIEIDGEFHIYYIQLTEKGLEAGGVSNAGFMPYGISVEWEDDCLLDYHLESLYELCYEDAMNGDY
jgi:hypothetical protein